jgi:integrase
MTVRSTANLQLFRDSEANPKHQFKMANDWLRVLPGSGLWLTPEQFNELIELMPEPYSSMVFVAVWTGLRVSELIALKWRCIHADAITIEQRYCRGDWSKPKTRASAATIGVSLEVIARLLRLKTLFVKVRAGRAIRDCKLVKSAG